MLACLVIGHETRDGYAVVFRGAFNGDTESVDAEGDALAYELAPGALEYSCYDPTGEAEEDVPDECYHADFGVDSGLVLARAKDDEEDLMDVGQNVYDACEKAAKELVRRLMRVGVISAPN